MPPRKKRAPKGDPAPNPVPSRGSPPENSVPSKTRPTAGRKSLPKHDDDRPAIEAARSLPFPVWAERYLKIRRDDGEIVPFVLNPVQLKLEAEWELQVKERGYVKIIVLKARKMGASTYVQGKMFRAVLERQGWHAGIMAHDDAGCDLIFDRAKVFNDYLPAEFQRSLDRNNKKEVAYKNPHGAFLRVNVAKARGAWGSGGDFHLIHFSERAKWPEVRGTSKAQGQATAIMNAQPKSVIGRAVVDESTAKGKGNQFHTAWEGAAPNVANGTRWGANGFVRMFFAWHEFPTYRDEGKKPEDIHAYAEAEEEEPMLRASYGCDDAQLAWRRRVMAEECQSDLDTFHQEYPSCAEESFLATGSPVFPASMLQERLSEIERREKANPTRRWAFNSKGELEEDRRGEIRFFRTSKKIDPKAENDDLDLTDSERFVITADPSGSGSSAPDQQKGDPCCAYVWDRERDEQICEWHGWTDPDQFAQELFWLWLLYGKPLLIVEAGAWGGHVIATLMRLGCDRLYFRENLADQHQNTPTNWGQYGWITSAKSKPQMVDALRDLWRNRSIRINALECVSEHLTFVKNGIKREAQVGCHDDRVMACAIFALWRFAHPYFKTPTAPPPKIQTMGDIMAEMLAAEKQGKGGRFMLC